MPFYLSASSIGSKLRSAVSLGSLNQDLMGIALSGGQKKKQVSQSVVSEKTDTVVMLCCSVKEATQSAADLMYCYIIYNTGFVVRMSRSVICPLSAPSQG